MAKSTAKKAVAPRKYNEALADNIRLQLTEIPHKIEEKNMFGGLCFMVNDKMCVGVETERMMVRLDPSLTEALLKKPGCRPMEFTGKVMKGFVFVDAAVLKTKKQVSYWLNMALDYNPLAKASKKKKL